MQLDKHCDIEITDPTGQGITKDIKGPLFFYYQIENFFQNHRRFVKSQNVVQLRGEGANLTLDKMNHTCSPVLTNNDLWPHQQYSFKGRKLALSQNKNITDSEFDQYKLKKTDVAVPCGLIAKSVFNDTFEIYKVNVVDGKKQYEKVPMKEDGIAWKSDVGFKYKN